MRVEEPRVPVDNPAAAYLGLFRPPLRPSAASRAYHQQFMEEADQVLWLSRLRVPRGPTLANLLASHGVKPRGVLHVGGHYGLELEGYLAAGIERVLFFEPNPLALKVLHQHLEFWQGWLRALGLPPRGYQVLEVAVSDREGTAVLHLAELEMLTSLQPPCASWIRVQDEISVRCARLDDLVEEPQNFNILNLDVQGHELQALAGARRVLSHQEAVLVELNHEPRYHGCAGPEQVDGLLAEAGLGCVNQARYGDVSDALYIRR